LGHGAYAFLDALFFWWVRRILLPTAFREQLNRCARAAGFMWLAISRQ
jgi:hypothetical protein